MEKLLDVIAKEVKKAFLDAGYDEELGKVTVSNRPDLCEYQCNGAMAGARKYHKAPLVIAGEVTEKLQDSTVFFRGGCSSAGLFEFESEGRVSHRVFRGNAGCGKIRVPSDWQRKENHH